MGKIVDNETGMNSTGKTQVLVVDNQPVVLKMLVNFLSNQGLEVLSAEDGLSALEILETETPTVIFTDLVMPNVSGEKLCKIIRDQPRFNNTYVAVISGIAADEEMDFISWGANACIAKCSFDQLSKHIHDVLDMAINYGVSKCCPEVMGLENLHQREMTKELLFSNKHFEVAISNMSEGVVEFVRDSKIVYANPAALAAFDVMEEKFIATKFIDLFTGKERKRISKIIAEIEKEPVFVTDDDPVVFNGKMLVLAFLPAVHDGYRSVIVIIRDITDRRLAEDMLAFEAGLNESAAKIAEMLLSSSSMADIANFILAEAKKMTGSTQGFIGHFDNESGELVAAAMSLASSAQDEQEVKNHFLVKLKGLWGWVLDNQQSLLVNNAADMPTAVELPEAHVPDRFLGAPAMLKGQLIGVLALADSKVDYTIQGRKVVERFASLYALAVQKYRSEARIEYLAHHDPLTGLVNRHLFVDRLESGMKLAERHRHKLALFFIDLNDFKMINDTLGHEAGDHVLTEVASRLQATVRSSDTVARLGGDEFMVIVQDVHDKRAAGVVAEKVLSAFRQPFLVNKKVCTIGAAIGISVYPDDGEESETLIRKADKVMYQVKAKGESGYDFFRVNQ